MSLPKRTVTVLQLPERVSMKERRRFLSEMALHVNTDRPYLVLDCSNAHRLDGPVIQLMLRCLEEAMKRSGDVKLAGIPVGADVLPGFLGTNRLFEVFDTTADAINSFHHIASARAGMGNSGSAA